MPSVWIEKRPQGYVLRWRGPEGVKHSSAAFPSKSEALDAGRNLEARLGVSLRKRKTGPRPRSFPSLEQLAQSWQAERGAGPRPGQGSYAALVVSTVKRLSEELNWPTTRDVNLESLRRWKQENAGGARALSYLRVVLRWASVAHDQPLDMRVDQALKAAPSQEEDVVPYTADQTRQVLYLAAMLGQLPLFSCLATYGWRPITGCRILCGDLRSDGTIKIGVKRNGPWLHPLFPEHIKQLGELAKGRPADERLFLSPSGKPWRVGQSADEVSRWYRDNLHPEDAAGNVYQLKRHAITTMHRGLAPWSRPLSIAEIQLFTGHRSKNQVLRYIKAHIDEARGVMGQLPHVGTCGADGALGDRNRPDQDQAAESQVLRFPGLSG